MGLNKAFVRLGNQSLIERSYQKLRNQSSTVFISYNGSNQGLLSNAGSIEADGQIVPDQHQPSRGPLEGLLSVMMEINRRTGEKTWLLSCPVDCPFIPNDMGSKLLSEAIRTNADAIVASYHGRRHFLCALWSTTLLHQLKEHLQGKRYSVASFLDKIHFEEYGFNDATYDPFLNINTLDDLQEATRMLKIPM